MGLGPGAVAGHDQVLVSLRRETRIPRTVQLPDPMTTIIKTFGPPGTGKTTRLIGRVGEEVANGVLMKDIAYLSFSVAAKEVIKERLGAKETEFLWFRTIHGAAVKSMGI